MNYRLSSVRWFHVACDFRFRITSCRNYYCQRHVVLCLCIYRWCLAACWWIGVGELQKLVKMSGERGVNSVTVHARAEVASSISSAPARVSSTRLTLVSLIIISTPCCSLGSLIEIKIASLNQLHTYSVWWPFAPLSSITSSCLLNNNPRTQCHDDTYI